MQGLGEHDMRALWERRSLSIARMTWHKPILSPFTASCVRCRVVWMYSVGSIHRSDHATSTTPHTRPVPIALCGEHQHGARTRG